LGSESSGKGVCFPVGFCNFLLVGELAAHKYLLEGIEDFFEEVLDYKGKKN
jgi:hypothetical protein